MPDSPTKLQRWLDVVSFLASRRIPASTEELWSNVPAYAPGLDGADKAKRAVRRTFERDKDELRALGIPIETVSYHVNYGREEIVGYRLARRDFHLPYLELLREAEGGEPGANETRSASSRPDTPGPGEPSVRPAGTPVFEISLDEAGAALDGLRELARLPGFPLAGAARSAFRKLAFDLDPAAIGETPVVYAEDAETSATADALRVLSAALQRRKAVSFAYRAMTTDSEERREVHPYGLLFQHGRWYLVAHDAGRDGIRMFRAGRMSDVSANPRAPGTPDYEIPDDFTLESYAGRRAWELGEESADAVDADVRFRFPRSLWAERNGHGALVEEHDDGAQLRRFAVRRREPFLRWVLSLAGDARIEAPDDMRREFRALAARAAALHGSGEADEDEEVKDGQ
jgi:proteasome accessory factor B